MAFKKKRCSVRGNAMYSSRSEAVLGLARLSLKQHVVNGGVYRCKHCRTWHVWTQQVAL